MQPQDYNITDSDSVIVLMQFNLGVQMLSKTHLLQPLNMDGPYCDYIFMDTFDYTTPMHNRGETLAKSIDYSL